MLRKHLRNPSALNGNTLLKLDLCYFKKLWSEECIETILPRKWWHKSSFWKIEKIILFTRTLHNKKLLITKKRHGFADCTTDNFWILKMSPIQSANLWHFLVFWIFFFCDHFSEDYENYDQIMTYFYRFSNEFFHGYSRINTIITDYTRSLS